MEFHSSLVYFLINGIHKMCDAMKQNESEVEKYDFFFFFGFFF